MLVGRRQLLITGVALSLATPGAAEQRGLDLALVDCNCWTGFVGVPVADAIGVSSNRIVAIGSEAVRARIDGRTDVVRLGGAFIMPVFRRIWSAKSPLDSWQTLLFSTGT